MNMYEAYYREVEMKLWADPNPEVCRCGGRGWVLSDLDTWHSCPYHDGPHPEDYCYEEATEAAPSPELAELAAVDAAAGVAPVEYGEDDIPF